MIVYKPQWIRFRTHTKNNETKTIVYNLLESNNFLFEDISAIVINQLLSVNINVAIDSNKIETEFKESIKVDFDKFIYELIDVGILTDSIISWDQIKIFKRKIGDLRIQQEKKSVDHKNESEVKKKLPFFQSDPESDYAAFIEEDRIPMSVMFELTYNCNERCVHCFNPGAARNDEEKSLRNDREEINLEHYAKLIDDIDSMGVVKVILTGGDPFVKPGIWKLLDLLLKSNLVIDIYTNGLALLGRTEKLSKYWPLSVGLSIYSGDDEIHNAITRIPNSLKKSLKVAKEFSNLGVALYFKCPIMTHNASSYYKVTEIAKEYGAIPQIDVSLTDAIDGDVTISENLQVKGDLLDIILRDPDIPLYVGKEAPDFGRQVKDKNQPFCGAGTQMMNITPEGDVTPCNSFPTNFGNLKTKSFKSIIKESQDLKDWQSIKIKDYDECGTHEKCNYCSRCPGQSFIEHGTPLKASSANCNMAITRMNLANFMRNGNDPLKGKSVGEALESKQTTHVIEKVTSKKQKSYRNDNVNLG